MFLSGTVEAIREEEDTRAHVSTGAAVVFHLDCSSSELAVRKTW